MWPLDQIAARHYRSGLRAAEQGDLDRLLAQFDPRCSFTFIGDSPLGAELRGRADIRRWFERFGRLLPEPRFAVRQMVIAGPPWRQRLASHVIIESTIGGEPYRNQFAHFLTLRWGRVVADLVVEDTQRWERACRHLAELGVAEASAGPLSPRSG